MINNYNYFEDGLKYPYRFISEAEAIHDACMAVGIFTAADSKNYERQVALTHAGKNVGAICTEKLRNFFEMLYYKCSLLEEGEVIILSESEKELIRNGIEENLIKPFYL